MELAGFQRTRVEQLCTALTLGGVACLHGPRGIGMSSVAETAAERLGLRFESLRVDGPPDHVMRTLLGHIDEDWPYPNNDGVLAHEALLVFLSNVEGASPRLFGLLDHLARHGRGLNADPHGVAVVLGVRSDVEGASFRVSDRLLARTTAIPFPVELSAANLAEVANLIAQEFGHGSPFTPESMDSVVLPEAGLRVLRKWITQAALAGERVDPESFGRQVTSSVANLIERVEYRGRRLAAAEYQRWADQFSGEMRAVADTLVRGMVERGYVMRNAEFHDILDGLVQRSGIPRGEGIAMCNWQAFGKSSPYITWELKERGKWGGPRSVELDLESDPDTWASVVGRRRRYALLADDFVGTGRTIEGAAERISDLLDRCADLHVRVLLVAGIVRGVQRISCLEARYGDRLQVFVGRVLQDQETCFHEQSVILPDPTSREKLADFCGEFGQATGHRWPKGFGDQGVLFALPSSVPNNTLPLIWYDDQPEVWCPLLPASAGN